MSLSLNKLENAVIHWQDDGLPWSPLFGDVYFSRADAIGETEHVFLQGNRLAERFADMTTQTFVVAELGFGSGLNFLCSWRLWDQVAPPGSTLHFISCEQYPLKYADLQRFHQMWPALSPYSEALQVQYPDHSAGVHRLILGSAEKPVILDLMYGEATEVYQELSARQQTHLSSRVDAWFLDGFAPRQNPGMWSGELFRALANLSDSHTTFATYSVAALVREGLEQAGFVFSKVPGYGSKRHMLSGYFKQEVPFHSGTPTSNSNSDGSNGTPTSSDGTPTSGASLPSVTVIGAGLAGAATAFALAEKGFRVQVLDRNPEPASGASGNPQGAVFLPLHRDVNERAALLRQAAIFAHRHYNRLTELGHGFDWHACGALQLSEKNGEGFFRKVSDNPLYSEAVTRLLSSDEATNQAGVTIDHEALLLPLSGWLNPAALCRGYLTHPHISLQTGCDIHALQPQDDRWLLKSANGKTVLECDNVVVAGSVDAPQLLPDHDYPLYPNRGQLSFVRASSKSLALHKVLCGKGYIMPAHNGQHCFGSSFARRSRDVELKNADHQHNLQLLQELCPALAASFSEADICGGRAALRCSTKDYLPLAGPVEDVKLSRKNFFQTVEARQNQRDFMVYQKGLYLCSGLGSHGLTTSPLLAEYLASHIAGQNLPLDSTALAMLQPSRFLQRALLQEQGSAAGRRNSDNRTGKQKKESRKPAQR